MHDLSVIAILQTRISDWMKYKPVHVSKLLKIEDNHIEISKNRKKNWIDKIKNIKEDF